MILKQSYSHGLSDKIHQCRLYNLECNCTLCIFFGEVFETDILSGRKAHVHVLSDTRVYNFWLLYNVYTEPPSKYD